MSRAVALLLALLAPGCGGVGVESPPSTDAGSTPGLAPIDAGAGDAGCGFSFDGAVDAYPGERVCQTTVYDRVTGYCTHWVACSSL